MDDKFYEDLSRHINNAFDGVFGRKTKKPKGKEPEMKPKLEFAHQPEEHQVYESIKDYTSKTGKRFRMTKNQKQRELTREEAFNETYGGQTR
jgi:hypothetical protein